MRLAELAKDRQVIIFTHRLSLLSLIEAAVKTMKDKASEHGLPAPITANTETLRKLGNDAGIVAKLSLRDAKPAKAISRITGEFYHKNILKMEMLIYTKEKLDKFVVNFEYL